MVNNVIDLLLLGKSIIFLLLLQVVHFITFYAPLWGAIIFNGITYFQVIRMLNNAARVRTRYPSLVSAVNFPDQITI